MKTSEFEICTATSGHETPYASPINDECQSANCTVVQDSSNGRAKCDRHPMLSTRRAAISSLSSLGFYIPDPEQAKKDAGSYTLAVATLPGGPCRASRGLLGSRVSLMNLLPVNVSGYFVLAYS